MLPLHVQDIETRNVLTKFVKEKLLSVKVFMVVGDTSSGENNNLKLLGFQG